MIRPLSFLIAMAVATALLPGAALAVDKKTAEKYGKCLAMVDKDPAQAFEFAITWRDEGGGGPAYHCVALALLGQGYKEEAALRLEKLALRPDAGGNKDRAEILSQAGNVWLLAERPQEADVDFTSAINLDAQNPEHYFDRAHAGYKLGQWAAVISDTTRAITLDRGYADAYVLRGSAKRAQGDLLGAVADIEYALKIDPENVGAALERAELVHLGVYKD